MFHNSTPLWRKAVSVSMMCVSSDRKPQVEVFALLHQFVIYFRSVSFSLPALTASVTKSSLPPVLSLDAMLDLCVFLSAILHSAIILFHLRCHPQNVGQKDVSSFMKGLSAMSSKLSGVSGRTGWSRRTVRRYGTVSLITGLGR